MAWEVLITGAIGIFCGIVLGALFSQLLFCFCSRSSACRWRWNL